MGYINLFCVMSLIYLNTTTFFNSNSLILTLILFLVCKSDHTQNLIFYTLINSGSIHYFVGTIFKYIYIYIPTILILFIKLKLFDGSLNNIISKTVFLPITFSSGYWMTLNVYITSLDSSCLLVFKYN